MANQHADKRSVSTDALETLGMIIGPNEKRDAIHIAVENVIASQWMEPGDHVDFVFDSKTHVGVVETGHGIGIVDPFLHEPVEKGQRFWLLVYPREIKSLRHVWTHPAFPDEIQNEPVVETTDDGRIEFIKELDGTNLSRRWIESYADGLGLGYDELMDAAADWIESHDGKWGGEYLNRGELLDGESTSPEFWIHYQKVTDKVVEADKQGNFFSCAC